VATECFVPIRVPGIRATKLNSCGAVNDDGCASVTTSGVITITIEKEVVDRQGDPQLNANGDICDDTTKPEIRRWYNVTIEFCRVDPQLINLMTGEPLVLDDAASPNVVGFRTRRGAVNLANFALEWWTGLGGDTFCVGGVQKYGYALMPFLSEGVMTIPTFQNDRANFSVTARTRFNTLWGTGPYNVLVNQTGPNAGNPGPLIAAMTADDDFHIQTTTLPPPLFNTCGCTDVTPLVVVAPLAGASPLNVTLTFPVDGAGVPILPAVIQWETGVFQTVTTGINVTHNYAAAGVKAVTYRPTTHSSPTYTTTVTVT
jgi:hypothetical protein